MKRNQKLETQFFTLKQVFEEKLGRPLKKEEQEFINEMVRNQWKENMKHRHNNQ